MPAKSPLAEPIEQRTKRERMGPGAGRVSRMTRSGTKLPFHGQSKYGGLRQKPPLKSSKEETVALGQFEF